MVRVFILLILVVVHSTFAEELAGPIKQYDAKQESSDNNNKTHDDEATSLFLVENIGLGIQRQLEIISSHLAPDHEKEKKQEANEQEALDIGRADLSQQESMANAAWGVFWTTVIQATIGTIGIYFLIQTLKETRRATNAALKAVEQNRAWVGYVEYQINNPINLTNGNHIDITWTNEGATYALDVVFEFQIEKLITQAVPAFQPQGNWKNIGILRVSQTHAERINVPANVINGIHNNGDKYVLYTCIRYSTIHGKECFTERVEEITIAVGVSQNLLSHQNNIYLSPIESQQTAT
jgi:hypothetical protein